MSNTKTVTTQIDSLQIEAVDQSTTLDVLSFLGIEVPEQSTEAIDEWVQVRHQITVLEAKRREIESMAVAQLQDLLEMQGKQKGTAYEVDNHLVILKSRKVAPKPEQIDGLAAIDHEIEERSKFIHQTNTEIKFYVGRIRELEESLSVLQSQYNEALSQDEDLASLVKEREDLIASATVEKPVLELREIKSK
jgi:hypothetical protein